MKNILHDINFFKTLLEALPNPIFYKDAEGVYKFCNTAFANYLGLEIDEIVDKTVFDIAPYELAKVYAEADRKMIENLQYQVYESRVKYADNTYHDVIFSKAAHIDDTGKVLGLVGIIQDISEKKAMEREVQMHYQLKDVFLKLNHDIILFSDEKSLLDALLIQVMSIFSACDQASVLEISDNEYLTVLAYSGYREEDMANFILPLDKSFMWQDVTGNIQSAHIVNNIKEYVSQGIQDVAIPLSGKPVQSSLIVPIWINEKLKWIFSLDSSDDQVYTEIDRKVADFIRDELPIVYRIFELYLKTLEMSRFDTLTGLINRRYFDEKHIEIHQHSDETLEPYTIGMFDLDGLKHVNDLYGHAAGDAYLIAFSEFISHADIGAELIARVGGDEFVGIFENCDPETLQLKLLEVRKAFETFAITSAPHKYYGSFSFGLATYTSDSKDRTKLFQIADLRMYKDKKR